MDKKNKNRQQYNQELAAILIGYLQTYPDIRFSQILVNFGFVKADYDDLIENYWHDEFYLESADLLERVKLALEKQS